MTQEFFLGIIASLLAVFLANLLGGFIKRRIRSGALNRDKLIPSITISDTKLEIQGLSEEKQSRFNLLSSIIGLHDGQGNLVGTGFLVGPNNAVTSNRVIESTGNDEGSTVKVRYALTGDFSEAVIEKRLPEQDIAILRLTTPLPLGVVPAALATAPNFGGQEFRSFGYPVNYPQGVWASGKIIGITDSDAQQRLQLQASSAFTNMSGSPIMDESTHQIVGMITGSYSGETPYASSTILATPLSSVYFSAAKEEVKNKS